MAGKSKQEKNQSFLKKTIQRVTFPSFHDKQDSRMSPSLNNRWLSAMKEEMRNARTFDLVSKTTNLLEKFFWAFIAIFGTIFIYQVVKFQWQNWDDNPTLLTTETKKLSDMPLPAVTFCHIGLHKYGLVEKLANFIDPEKKIPKEVVAVRNEFLKVQFNRAKDTLGSQGFCQWLFGLKGNEKEDNPIINQILDDQRESKETECIVSLVHFCKINHIYKHFTLFDHYRNLQNL